MSILRAAKRNSLPKSEFGLPGSRKYPMPDRSHAANAKARATQMVKRGKLSPASAAKIRAKANRILAVLFLCVGLALPAHAAIHTLQVTIGSGTTQMLPAGEIYCRWIVFQNNTASDAMRIGDSNTTSSRGIKLAAGASFFAPPSGQGANERLSTWYVQGTQNDVIDVIYDDGQ